LEEAMAKEKKRKNSQLIVRLNKEEKDALIFAMTLIRARQGKCGTSSVNF
jgi:hypothetical protein